jgi:AcrR family transcriptional regulator
MTAEFIAPAAGLDEAVVDGATIDEITDPRTIATRERILSAAIEQLSESGYNGISLADIAKRAGLTRSGLLHHFESKEVLLREALGHRLLSNAKSLHAIESATAFEMLDAVVRMVEFTTWIPNAARAHQILAAEATAPENPAHDWFAEQFAFVRGNMAAALQRSIATGEVRADVDIDAVTMQLLAMSDGLQLHWLHSPDSNPLASARYMVELIRADLAPRTSPPA